MKPVAIFRHVAHEGPGYLGDVLEQRGIPWQLIAIDQAMPVPASPADFSGLVFMGGPMSVNDDLPWIAPTLDLIRQAVAANVPVLGHCLGGQLIAKALGGVVSRNPVKEIGWGEVQASDHPEALAWLGGMRQFTAFHWHGETFSLPSRATHLLASRYCQNQAFVLGNHLAMQCHIEMTEPMIREWCSVGEAELAAANSPAVDSAEDMLARTPMHLAEMRQAADAIYRRWIGGLQVS